MIIRLLAEHLPAYRVRLLETLDLDLVRFGRVAPDEAVAAHLSDAPDVRAFLAHVERESSVHRDAYRRAEERLTKEGPAQPFTLPPFSLYRSLRRTNPSPFMFYFNFGGFQVIVASPEILVRVFDGEVTIRPIAGTRPRGKTPLIVPVREIGRAAGVANAGR